MSVRLRARLRRLLERTKLAEGHCPECPPVQYISWNPREPEPDPRCPGCGRKAECILVAEQIVEAGPEGAAAAAE
jgi:hypothetical protein